MDILMPLSMLQAKKLTALEKMICAVVLMHKNAYRLTNIELSKIIFAPQDSIKNSLMRLEKKHIILKDGHKFDRTLSVINENIA